jgi:putative membrane protein
MMISPGDRRADLRTAATTAVKGFCMGAADIVPGVSGGTVALVFGIYRRLVDNIRAGAAALGSFLRLDVTRAVSHLRSVEWAFLVSLLAGIGVALVALSHLIETLLHDHPQEMAGLFLGLVAASVVIAWRMIQRRTPLDHMLVVTVAVAAFVLLGFQSGIVTDPEPWQFVAAAAVAICAMILPGISGSFILLMLGMYSPVLAAVNDRELADLALFASGAAVGLALFSTLLGWLLSRHGDQVLAALIGLMIGSVRVLWPWPHGVGIISDDEDEVVRGTDLDLPTGFADFLWPTVLALVAFTVVLGISMGAERRARDRVGERSTESDTEQVRQ